MLIYKTQEQPGYGKQKNYHWNEYRLEGDTVVKYRCHRYKFFDGRESTWEYEESEEESWKTNSPYFPEWLKNYL